jgi:hypothetical protein
VYGTVNLKDEGGPSGLRTQRGKEVGHVLRQRRGRKLVDFAPELDGGKLVPVTREEDDVGHVIDNRHDFVPLVQVRRPCVEVTVGGAPERGKRDGGRDELERGSLIDLYATMERSAERL